MDQKQTRIHLHFQKKMILFIIEDKTSDEEKEESEVEDGTDSGPSSQYVAQSVPSSSTASDSGNGFVSQHSDQLLILFFFQFLMLL